MSRTRTRTRTRQALAVLFVLGSAALAGFWAYHQALQPTVSYASAHDPAPAWPAGTSPVQIDWPPEQEPAQALSSNSSSATVAGAGATAAVQPPHPLNQIWEFNAQQPPTLLPQPLTEPSWYITGVVQQGDNTRVMVQFQGESTVRFYKIGDVLPGGSQLAWVKPGAIGVVTPKRKKLQVPILEGSQAAAATNTAAQPKPQAR